MPADTISPLLAYIVLGFIAANPVILGPSHAEVWSVTGACAGVLWLILTTLREKRGQRIVRQAAAVGVAGFLCGICGPNLMVKWFIKESVAAQLGWAEYVVFGVGFSLSGLLIFQWGVRKLDSSVPVILDTIFPWGSKKDKEDDNE